jgi:hypothetical protein
MFPGWHFDHRHFCPAARNHATYRSGGVIADSSQSCPVDKKNTSPGYSVGTCYSFTVILSAGLEWEIYCEVGDKNTTDKSDVDLSALSVRYTP